MKEWGKDNVQQEDRADSCPISTHYMETWVNDRVTGIEEFEVSCNAAQISSLQTSRRGRVGKEQDERGVRGSLWLFSKRKKWDRKVSDMRLGS
jgi:hypothetical protein